MSIRLLTAILAGLLVLTGSGVTWAATATPPPTNLKKVGDHWTPWDPPEPSPEHYIIQKDDTLWDLAQKWFGDPYLWPQIWDENRYILDSHWIYPGDPLVVPGRPTVVPEDAPPPIASLQPSGEGAGGTGVRAGAGESRPSPPRQPAPPPLMPAADATDMYCSGYIAPEDFETDLWVAGAQYEREGLGQGDVVFLNRGRNAGVRAGEEYAIIRRTDYVKHPRTRQQLGVFVRRMGRARVLIAHENSSTALIEMSCEEVYQRDELVPWSEIPSPMLSSTPEFDQLDTDLGDGPTGHVVWQRDRLSAMGAGHVIYTDLGRVSGAKPGDFVRLFRDRHGELPPMPIGQAVILTVGPDTSSAKITHSVREGELGDRVVLQLN